MPQLDYAVVCDYARADHGIAHVIAAGIDTFFHSQVPAGQNFGLLLRATFTRNECGRQHTFEFVFQGADGERLAQVQGSITPEWPAQHPPGWPVGAILALNMGVPIPAFGDYSLEILINGNSVKSIPLRAVHSEQ
jgi:hypothetical protein